LWLILIGCVIKVFIQVEFGRYSIVNGDSTMEALNSVPGPRIRGHGNWIVWYWFLMWLASIGQLGGIVGGVGQALAISVPLTENGREFNEFVDHKTKLTVRKAELELLEASARANGQRDEATVSRLDSDIGALNEWINTEEQTLIAEIGEERSDELGRRPREPIASGLCFSVVCFRCYVLLCTCSSQNPPSLF